jgi:AraC family transcriptional regulator of adaptative response / DNA-3-methyladenine glycosylase II
VLALPHATGVVSFTPEADAVMAAAVRSSTSRPVVRCELQLEDLRDLTAAVQRCRALLDLDADPQAIDAVLGADAILAPVVSASPGRRVPGTGDPAELALRAVLAQDVEGFAGEEAAQLVARFGKPLTVPIGSITHTFPPPEILAEADLSGLDLDPRRQAALRAMATALANGDVDLDVGAEREQAVEQLRAIPELKPITIATIRMRALGDPDVFVPDDPTVARVLHEHGISDPAAVARHTENWRPWRSYAVSYLLDSMNSTFARV